MMVQETRIVDYESMVNKYMNEWEGCNLREFCFSEKVNIYRMLKTMKKMGVSKEPVSHGLKPLEFSEMQKTHDVEDAIRFSDDGCVHNVKLTCGRIYIFMSKDQRKLRVFYYHHRGFILTEKVLSEGKFLRPIYDESAKCYRMSWLDFVRMLEGIVPEREYFRPTKYSEHAFHRDLQDSTRS